MTNKKQTVKKQEVDNKTKVNLLERHIQNILKDKLTTADDKILADAIKTLLNQEENNPNIH